MTPFVPRLRTIVVSAFALAACAGPSPRAVSRGEEDAASPIAAPCVDVVALCKAQNVACGSVLARDPACGRDVTVDCGPCVGASTDRRAVIARPASFEMGNPLPTAPSSERPSYRVQLAPFAIDRWEVTVDEYAACVAAKVCTPPGDTGACNYRVDGRSRHPINCVDWLQANAYCSFVGARLPTEEEWEYVARDGAGSRLYPWGNLSPTGLDTMGVPGVALCWSGSSAGALGSSCPVGRDGVLDRTRSDFDLVGDEKAIEDLAGNLREWTVDGASASYDVTRETSFRVVRGGGWFVDVTPTSVNAVRRTATIPISRLPDLGFRCVLPLARVL